MLELHAKKLLSIKRLCGGTGKDSTVPTNNVRVPIATGTVTDRGSEYTGFIGVICRYLYRTGEL